MSRAVIREAIIAPNARTWMGDVARDRRKALRLTQSEVADALGVQRTTVGSWEQGEHPQLRYAAALADLLGLSLDSLIAHDPEAASAANGHEQHDQEVPADADAPAAVVAGATNAGRREGALTEE